MTPEVETIIDTLKKEPEELKEGSLSVLWRWLKSPVTICLWPIRAACMSLMVPVAGQQTIDREFNDFKIKNIDYKTHSNGYCSMIIVAKNNNITIAERKLIINFPGNAEGASNVVNNFLGKQESNYKQDLLAVGYPRYSTTTQQLVDAGVSAVIRAIKAGYKPENITIAGHSLGGAVSALVLKEISTKYPNVMKGQKFAGYINHRSLTNLGDFFAAHVNHKNNNSFKDADRSFINDTTSSWLGWSINVFASLIGVQLDAASALLSPNSLPVTQMKFYADDTDSVIRHGASMAARMEGIKSTIPTKIKYTRNFHAKYQVYTGHNGAQSNSMYKFSKSYEHWGSKEKEKDKAKSILYHTYDTKNNILVTDDKHMQQYIKIKRKDNPSTSEVQL